MYSAAIYSDGYGLKSNNMIEVIKNITDPCVTDWYYYVNKSASVVSEKKIGQK